MSETSQDFILLQQVQSDVEAANVTPLKKGTRWHHVGNTEFGAVFSTKDQIVTVKATHIHEAQIVVSNQGCLAGFFLPVERTFTPLSKPVRIEIQTIQPQPTIKSR